MVQLIGIGKKILNIIYKIMCLKDTDKQVLFMSRENNEPGIDFSLIEAQIRKDHSDYRTVMLCKRIPDGIVGKIAYLFHILKQMHLMAQSSVIILDTYCIPVSILKHRDHQIVVQLWHSIGTMKKNSYSILDEPEGRASEIAYAMNMHENYDVIFCAGQGYRSYLAESFNYPSEALTIMPLPRVDVLRDKDYQMKKRQEIFDNYPELRNGKNIVYAPTFRKNKEEKEPFDVAVGALKEAVKRKDGKYNLIVKAHPLSDVNSDCPEYTTADVLSVADYLISDYSCVIYEAGIMDIPLYFYTYDYDEYMSRRSVYLDYPNEIPGSMHSDAEELIEALDSANYDMREHQRFIRKYVELPQGLATPEIVRFIFNKLGETNGY